MLIKTSNKVGVVGYNGRFRCYICCNSFCCHVQSARENTEMNDPDPVLLDITLKSSQRTRYVLHSISHEKISYVCDKRLEYCLKHPVSNYLEKVNGELTCSDNSDSCRECGSSLTEKTLPNKLNLFTKNDVFHVKGIYFHLCLF